MSSNRGSDGLNLVLAITIFADVIIIIICPYVIIPVIITTVSTGAAILLRINGSPSKIADIIAIIAWLIAVANYDRDTGAFVLLFQIIIVIQVLACKFTLNNNGVRK